MLKIAKQSRCKNFCFSTFSQNYLTLGYVMFSVKSNVKLSDNILKVLKTIHKCSFYRSIEIISDISNLSERKYVLQIFYSAVTYVENHYPANLIKLWIDDIFIKQVAQFNNVLNNYDFSDYITIKLGFEYRIKETENI